MWRRLRVWLIRWRRKGRKIKKGTNKKQLTIEESITSENKNGTVEGLQTKDKTEESTGTANLERQTVQESVDEETADLVVLDETEKRGEDKAVDVVPAEEEEDMSAESLRTKRCAWLPVL